MRAFVAIPIPEPMRGALAGMQARLPVGRPVPEESLHLTLAFLGDADERTLVAVHEALDGRAWAACTLRAVGLVTFGGDNPVLVAADIAAEPELVGLHKRVAGAVRQAGVALKRERFRPHVTLARFGRGLDRGGQRRLVEAMALCGGGPDWPEQRAEAMTLFSSDLTPRGAIHEPLAIYRLT